ncbi:MAG TPA: AAA family ATPase [Streptosporangiaceae bacterium]|nr:AAA family ATPase [Streptosporangiaceae bacterium]
MSAALLALPETAIEMISAHAAADATTTDNLTGRDAELATLAALLSGISDQGSAIVVTGDAGIGKSSLLTALARRAREARLRVLSTTGVESEAQLPFGGLHQLLRPVLRHDDRLPVIQRRALRTAFGDEEGTESEPFLIALASLNLLAEAASEQPVVIVADDVHWLDGPTQEVLTFVARRVSADPIVLVGSVRTGHDIPFASAGLARLDVRALTDEEARTVLTRQANDLSSADRERVVREAQGNPLALVELPTALRAVAAGEELHPGYVPLTVRLERAFATRIADLPALTRDAVLVAAVDYADELPEILAAASVLAGQPVTVAALEAAAAADLIRLDDLHLRFRHPLVRSGILQRETIVRRQAANAALAQILEHEPYRRTWHRAQAIFGPDEAVADELEDSHLISLRRGSATAAIWALERAAQLTTDSAKRGRRLLLAAEHAFGLGRADLVDSLLSRAAQTTLSRLQLARMEWLREIFNDGVPGDAGRVFELCDIALEAITADDADLALNLLLGAALRGWWADTGPAARAQIAEVAGLLDGAQDDPRYVAVLAVAEPVAQSETVISRLDSVVLETVTDPAALWMLGMAAHAVGEPVCAVDLLGRAESKLREQGRLALLSQVLTMQVLDHVELGDWDRAQSAGEEGLRLARETGQPIWDSGNQILLAVVAALRGHSQDAESLAARAEQAAHGQRLTDLLACVQLARGLALMSAGQFADAYETLARLFVPGDPAFHLAERFHGVMYLAEAAVRAGREKDVRPVISALEAQALTAPSATLRLHLSYARAVLAPDDQAEELFQAALEADLIRWPWLRARLDLAYGSWLRRQRRVAQARTPLRSALSTFDLIGAVAWAEQARTELRAAGERGVAEAPGIAAAALLSAQELQIARLAAEGLSNREIGERLYLSPRTVGSHLYRIFPKLNITARSQLASRLESA